MPQPQRDQACIHGNQQRESNKDEKRRAERLKELQNLNSVAKKANPLVTVVNTESAFKATELFINYSSYFLDMPEMNIKWLYNELCRIHGGVSEISQHVNSISALWM